MRAVAASLATLVLLTSGCMTVRSADSGALGDASASSSPAPDLVGTWSGTAFAVGGSSYLISTPVDLTIRPDGTWSWSKRGQEQAKGRVTMRGNHVILDEQTAKEGAQRIELEQRGMELSGLSRAFIPGAPSAVQLRKAPS